MLNRILHLCKQLTAQHTFIKIKNFRVQIQLSKKKAVSCFTGRVSFFAPSLQKLEATLKSNFEEE